jgi:hypothetical protein
MTAIIKAKQSDGREVLLNPRHVVAAYVVTPEETQGTIAESGRHRVIAVMSEGSVYTVHAASSLGQAEQLRDRLAESW